MKKLIKIFLLLILFLIHTTKAYAYSDYYSPEKIFELHSDNDSKYTVMVFFSGLGSGLRWMNTDLDNSDRLFCFPRDKGMTPNEYFAIYKNEYYKYREFYDSQEYQPPGFILIHGLKDKYPCN